MEPYSSASFTNGSQTVQLWLDINDEGTECYVNRQYKLWWIPYWKTRKAFTDLLMATLDYDRLYAYYKEQGYEEI